MKKLSKYDTQGRRKIPEPINTNRVIDPDPEVHRVALAILRGMANGQMHTLEDMCHLVPEDDETIATFGKAVAALMRRGFISPFSDSSNPIKQAVN